MSKSLCSSNLYKKFLMVTSQKYSALSLSQISPSPLSHDSISRWLSTAKCQPKDIWRVVKPKVLNTKGVLIFDDSIIDKTRSKKIGLTKWQYSGTRHDIIRGIGVLNAIWNINTTKNYYPIDFRIYDPPEDNKTKNHHLREMVNLAFKRGLKPECVVADSWYSSLKNLKCIRDKDWFWVMGLKKNRKVNRNQDLKDLDIPKTGLEVHLKGYGFIHVFKFASKNGRIDYIGTNIPKPNIKTIRSYVKQRWSIEVYHRELKQTCGLESCMARTSRAQRNHIALSVLCWLDLNERRVLDGISLYKQQWNVVKYSIANQLRIEMARC